MCYPLQCNTCGKTTWGGCGQHVDQVFAGMPDEQRCKCHEQNPSEAFFKRMFG